ncbi:MAG: CopG family transcriptional regulator [Chloroflexota bacterium]
MHRTTIVAPEELIDRLRDQAESRGVSLATVIREALEAKAAAFRPKPLSVGMFDSGHTDRSVLSADTPLDHPAWRSS